MNHMSKKANLGIIIFLVIAVIFLFSFRGCTLVGCSDSIGIEVSQGLPEKFILEINGIRVDNCLQNNYSIYDNSFSLETGLGRVVRINFPDLKISFVIISEYSAPYEKTQITFSPYMFSDERLKSINFSLLGRHNCFYGPEIMADTRNHLLIYKDYRPNGPFCEPTCLAATVKLEGKPLTVGTFENPIRVPSSGGITP